MYKIKLKRYIKYLFLFLMAFFIFTFGFKKPQQNRDWALDQSILPSISFWDNKKGFDINHIRNWEYSSLNNIQSKAYLNTSYLYSDLEGMKFYVTPLDKKELTAHTFVVFSFNNKYGEPQKNLALSIESRREKDIPYSIIKGALNQYEVINIWASAQDVITKRTIYWGDKVHEYKITLPKKEQISILKAFLASSKKLQNQPQFYNTITRNCTNLLTQHINEFYPKKIPWNYSFIFTGHSGKYLESLGYTKFTRTLSP